MAEPFPLSPSLWAATAPAAASTPPLDAGTEADVCIIGGGYAGLSTALHLAEQGISAGGKIVMLEGAGGESYLQLELPFDRAWASLERALEDSTFKITDRDRSSGVYYVVFEGVEEEEKGWWASLWNSDSARPLIGQAFVVSVQTVSEQAVTIRLQPQNADMPYDNREGQELLAMIKGNID